MNSTANCMRIIYVHVIYVVLPVAKCAANAEGNKADYKQHLNQLDFSIIKLNVNRP